MEVVSDNAAVLRESKLEDDAAMIRGQLDRFVDWRLGKDMDKIDKSLYTTRGFVGMLTFKSAPSTAEAVAIRLCDCQRHAAQIVWSSSERCLTQYLTNTRAIRTCQNNRSRVTMCPLAGPVIQSLFVRAKWNILWVFLLFVIPCHSYAAGASTDKFN